MANIAQWNAAPSDLWTRPGRTSHAEGTTPAGGYTPPGPGGRAAVWSDTFVEQTAGINALFKNANAASNTYFQWRACADYIIDLGFRTVRDRLIPTGSAARTNQRVAYPYLAAAGVKVHSTIGVWTQPNRTDFAHNTDVINEIMTTYGTDAADVFRSFGGANESNDSPKEAGWQTWTVNQQQDIWNKLGANATLNPIPICGPALKDAEASLQADFVALGAAGINPYCDFGDFHRYPGGLPTNLLDQRITWARQAFGSPKVLYCTEGGFNSGGTGGGVNFPEAIQAAYYPRWFAEHWLRGTRPFMFELMDDPGVGWEANFGIVEVNGSLDPADWTPKAAYTTLKRFWGRLADPGSTWTPASLSITVSGGNSNYNDILLQRRDGKWLLLMWRDEKLYTTPNGPTVTVAAQTITVALGTARPLAVYNPRTSATAVATSASATSHTVSLAGDLLIVEIG